MGQKISEFSFENLKDNYRELLSELQEFLIKNGSKTKISATKLGGFQKELEKIENLENQEVANLIGVANKYLQLKIFLKNEYNNINFKNEDIIESINGKHTLNDTDEKYNDVFFELSLAARFIKSEVKSEVNLDSICDIIIDDEAAIECKYIHSLRKVTNNTSYAIKQIERRISDGLAEYGYVALDLSHIVDKTEIMRFTEEVFESFLSSYESLAGTSCFSNELKEKGIAYSVLSDGCFIRIIQAYINHKMEVAFYGNLDKKVISKMEENKNVKAIIFQINEYFCFEHDQELFPTPVRAMGYYINKTLIESEYREVQQYLHKLAVGI